MKQRRSGIAVRMSTVTAVAAMALAAFGVGSASAATIYMKDVKGKPVFASPKAITVGEELKIVNQSNMRKVGPHTFSLVTKSSLPKTPGARRSCFAPKHICRAIAAWHGTNGNSPVTKNPAKAGAAGWDTSGSVSAKGDSWFTGEKPGVSSFSQEVTFEITEPTRIYYLCAIHPFMQGTTTVQPAAAG